MRVAAAACVLILCAACAWAGSGYFQRATVTGMQITDCVWGHRSVMAALSGTADNTLRHESCAEYILVSPTTIFRVQASKSAPLLLPAEEVDFRAGKGALMLRRDDEQDGFEVKVVCMQLRNSTRDACAMADTVPVVAKVAR